MKGDKDVKKLIEEINEISSQWLKIVNSTNQDALTDRMLEGIVTRAKTLGKIHEGRFEDGK